LLEQMSLHNVMDATMLLRDEESMDEFAPHFAAFLSVAEAEEVLLRCIIYISIYIYIYIYMYCIYRSPTQVEYVCMYVYVYIYI